MIILAALALWALAGGTTLCLLTLGDLREQVRVVQALLERMHGTAPEMIDVDLDRLREVAAGNGQDAD
jgi:hypothetical protein